MSFKDHFTLMATYNLRMNHQVFEAASYLTKEKLDKDSGAFFNSVMGTLNHLLVGDLLWLSRFESHLDKYLLLSTINEYPKPRRLEEMLYPEFSDLRKVRKEIDTVICKWVEETDEGDFKQNLTYRNSKNITSVRNFGELVFHLFNHQTHHRGQVSTLLNQHGLDVGITDFLVYIPENEML